MGLEAVKWLLGLQASAAGERMAAYGQLLATRLRYD